jgi:hypothetical protein
MRGPSRSLCRGDGEEVPFAGHALEPVGAAVVELECPDPITRSRSVLETSTSFGPARALTRAPMCAPWGDGAPPWGWGAPPRPAWSGPIPPSWGPPPPPFDYWGYPVTPVWDPGFNQWGFWLFGVWIPL